MRAILPCMVLLFVLSACQQDDDEAAIRKVLEKESATWRSGDVRAHADCWSIRPYSRILVSLPDGRAIDVPPRKMLDPDPGSMGNGGSAVNSNYRFQIQGAFATVSHDEVSTAKDGSRSYSYEFRTLEKVSGDWKITGQSIHVFQKP